MMSYGEHFTDGMLLYGKLSKKTQQMNQPILSWLLGRGQGQEYIRE